MWVAFIRTIAADIGIRLSYWHWIDKMGKQEAIQNRMGEFARHNFGREMFWEIRQLLESHPALRG